MWRGIEQNCPQAATARQLLLEADQWYQKGLTLFENRDAVGARVAFERGARLAPIEPNHYFRLAKIYHRHGMVEKAGKYFEKYLRAVPDGDSSEEAGAALTEIARNSIDVLDPDQSEQAPPVGEPVSTLWWTLGAAAGIVLAAILWLVVRYRRGASLTGLIEKNATLHTAIAYLIGTMRHELLKHRIGPVADVATALSSGQITPAQEAYLRQKLFAGIGIDTAWQMHVRAFEQALGGQFNHRRDRQFRAAARAIDAVAAFQPKLLGISGPAVGQLSRAHDELRRFDRFLGDQLSLLVRTRIDKPFAKQVFEELRGEYAVSTVALDELSYEIGTSSVFIEVPRADLMVILKNILRNAIFAVRSNRENRRVQMALHTELQPTGDEVVRLYVRDSGLEPLTTEAIAGSDLNTGLGLVMAAVQRYNGTVEVQSAPAPYNKAVIVRFFRSLEEEEESLR